MIQSLTKKPKNELSTDILPPSPSCFQNKQECTVQLSFENDCDEAALCVKDVSSFILVIKWRKIWVQSMEHSTRGCK